MRSLAALIFIITILVSCQIANIEVVKTHPNGNTKAEIIRSSVEGKYVVNIYHENGRIKTIANYLNYSQNGLERNFRPDGSLISEHNYTNGKKVGISKAFNKKNRLIKIQKYNNREQIVFIERYDDKGEQIKDIKSRIPLINAQSDTIRLGDTYKAEIGLGNRLYDKIQVYIGINEFDPNKYRDKLLSNIDDSTSIYSYQPKEVGIFTFKGIIVNMENFHNNEAAVE